MISFILHRVFF